MKSDGNETKKRHKQKNISENNNEKTPQNQTKIQSKNKNMK